jgi:hypothetical protein
VHWLLSRQEQVVQGEMGEEPLLFSEHIVYKAKRTLDLSSTLRATAHDQRHKDDDIPPPEMQSDAPVHLSRVRRTVVPGI